MIERIKLPNGCPLIGKIREAYGDKKYAGKNGVGDLRSFLNLAVYDYCADIYYINTQNKGILYEKKGKDIKHAIEQLESLARVIIARQLPLDKMFTDATIPPEHRRLFEFRSVTGFEGRILIKKMFNDGKGKIAGVNGVPINHVT